MADLQLWRVEVTQTWECSGLAWVWADSRMAAQRSARRGVDFDQLDADDNGIEADAQAMAITAVEGIRPDREWLVLPDGTVTQDVDEFRAVLSPEMQFTLQQRRWERNGQLTMEVEV
jgi:hypothetical protein